MKMLRLFFVLTLICGVIYPLIVTVIGQGLFSDKANGSIVMVNGKAIGSKLFAQKFSGTNFFHSRPSASDYVGVGSGATQFSATHAGGRKILEERRQQLPLEGIDAWTASGSGLDPHISPKTAFAQIARVAASRGVSQEALTTLITKHIEGPTLGIWGQPRVNVLELNLALLSEGKDGDTGTTPREP